MAYEVTASRRRPKGFDSLEGQEFVVSTLKNSIAQNRIAHAYLFSGPRGVGKTSAARILAKALNCENGPTGDPCGTCSQCREITAGNSMNVIEIDGASNTSVNDVRTIKDEVLFPPNGSRYKIYIIDEVHMLSTSAFNALLKTIEEPPEYVVFIFATTELQKVPATIRSRCQQFHFRLLPLETVKSCLAAACDEIGVIADDDALFWIAKESTGSMRDAYTLFDQVVSFCDGHITLDKIRDKLGLTGLQQILSVIASAAKGDGKGAIEGVHTMISDGIAIEQIIKDFATCFRSMLLIKNGITSEEALGERIADFPTDILRAFSSDQLEKGMGLFLNLYRDVRYSLNPRFDLELAVSRIASLRYDINPNELVKRLEALKKDLVYECREVNPSAVVVDKAPEKSEPAKIEPEKKPEEAAPQPEAPAPSRDFTGEDVRPVAEILKNKSFMLQTQFLTIKNAVTENGVLSLYFPNELEVNRLGAELVAIAEAIHQVCGFSGKICILKYEPPKKVYSEPVKNVMDAFDAEEV